MKIVPLDKDGKYLMQTFLNLVPMYDTTRGVYTCLNKIAHNSGNPKFAKTKNCANKMKRLFLDIYKRICLKLSKKNAQKLFLAPELEEKIVLVIRHYNNLKTKDIFIKICNRYIGRHQFGKVTESQEIQFYEQVNQKVFSDGNLKKEKIDFQQDEFHEEGSKNEKVVMFANGQHDEDDDYQEENQVEKKQKNWDHQIENQIKKVEQELKKAKNQRIESENSFQKEEYKPDHKEKIESKLPNALQHQNEDDKEEDKKESDEQADQTANNQETKEEQGINRQKQKKQSKKEVKTQDVKKSKTQLKMERRKILKAKGPKDTTPMQLKDDEDVWTQETYKSLGRQFLRQQNNLMNLAKQFSAKENICPVITVKELASKLVKLMLRGFKVYAKICQKLYNKKFQISQITYFEAKYISAFLMSSKGSVARKKLIRIYLNFKDPEFEIKEKEAYEIFLHLKEGLSHVLRKAEEELCEDQELIRLLEAGNFTIEKQWQEEEQEELVEKPKEGAKKRGRPCTKPKQLKDKKKPHLAPDSDDLITFKVGKASKNHQRQ